jgi:outer membrane protein assembly factor BamB
MIQQRMARSLTCAILCLLPFAAPAQKAKSDDGNWPQWRGPDASGMARGDAPVRFNDTENIKWKTPIPGRGQSTPVIWGDRIFLTTAVPTESRSADATPASLPPAAGPGSPAAPAQENRRGFGGGNAGPQSEHRFEVLCLSRSSGRVLWQKTARVATPHEGYHRTYGSFASNSPVTDGKRIYAFFGSRGIYCYDLDGNLLWEKDFGVQMRMHMQFGEGTPAVLHADRVLLKFDHNAGSFMVALDKDTGKEIWRVSRDEMTSWSGPLVVEHQGRKQIVVSATNKVRAYDFQAGSLLWECAGLGANVIPDPVHQNGIVFVMSGYRNPNLLAIRLGRAGDLTGTDAIVWSQNRGLSYTASPLLHDNRLYVLTDNGMLSCFNAATGEAFYHQVRLPKTYSFKASPVGAAGKLYLASEDGDVVVVKMGPEFEVLATNTLAGQMFVASPVIAAGEILLRSQNQIFCISQNR